MHMKKARNAQGKAHPTNKKQTAAIQINSLEILRNDFLSHFHDLKLYFAEVCGTNNKILAFDISNFFPTLTFVT